MQDGKQTLGGKPEAQGAAGQLPCVRILESDIDAWSDHVRERIERAQPEIFSGEQAGVQVFNATKHGGRETLELKHFLLHNVERPAHGLGSRDASQDTLRQRSIDQTHMTVTLLTCINRKIDCQLLERVAMRQMARNLRMLVLEDCSIKDQDVEFVAAALGRLVGGEPLCQLRSLMLTNNFITAKGAEKLAKALVVCTCMQELYLDWNNCGAQGCTHIADALVANTSLQLLHLAANDLRDKGIMCLARALERNAGLTELDVATDNITASGATALANMLKVNSTLVSLSLNGNSIGTDGGSSIAQALEAHNTVLQTLSLDSSGVSPPFFLNMAAALRSPSCPIISISACRNSAGDNGARCMAQALMFNTALTRLGLASCGMTEETVSYLLETAGSVGNLRELNLRDNAGQDRSLFLHNPHAPRAHAR
jgi:Ran GTPase-activating protein (RanGAP) involved in mRNA processing and transport